jgi:hypothetical protein
VERPAARGRRRLLAIAAAGTALVGGSAVSAQTAQAETAQAETAQAETAQAETAQAETAQAQTAQAQTSQSAQTSCTLCHSDAEFFDEEGVAIARQHAESIHAAAGISCHDCHGGNPDRELADDIFGAMDETFAENPYVGVPAREGIPGFCGRCHSDPTFMNRFAPDLPTDQEQEYWTSHHGRRLREGDERVATCVDCHGTHDIANTDDPGAPTYATRVAETCRRCHADAELMAGSTLEDGSPLPVDQYALWSQSVHAESLLDRQDLSAPTCNDCHGNHGATPPGLDSLTFVCGQCHGRQAELFRASPKRDLLRAHADFMADAGEQGCALCHEATEPQAELTDFPGFGECNSCHGHHGVVRPTIAMLSPLPDAPCAFCHEPVSADGQAVVEPESAGSRYLETRDALLAAAPEGLDRDGRFDWMVDQALALPFHTNPGEEDAAPIPREEFRRLFEKFRIGKTHFVYRDPVTGESVERKVLRCGHCHGPEPIFGEPTGYETARAMIEHVRELTSEVAQAERVLLRARRGGVETREAQRAIEQAIDAQIELEVLTHSFSTAEDGPFLAKHAEGLGHAEEALAAGRESIDELFSRRRGLYVSLGFVLLLLVGLGLKIREIS